MTFGMIPPPESISIAEARRLALVAAGLLAPRRVGLPDRAGARRGEARERCHRVVRHFGYLQLDTVAVSGARSHCIVLASRLRGLDAALGETLLAPGEPLFEYWGHEACWLPIALYPCFEWRRRQYRVHPWWGDVLREHPGVTRSVLQRVEREGPLRSIDLEGSGSGKGGWWDLKLTRRVAESLWLAGRLAVRERRSFQRSFDLVERVIPDGARSRRVSTAAAFDTLLLRALAGHGWASTGTLASDVASGQVPGADQRLAANACRSGDRIHPVRASYRERRTVPGWIRVEDLERHSRDSNACDRDAIGECCCHPSIPLLWDRARVQILFDFEQRIEIYKPASQRRYGYYCLPVLAGDRLIGRVDLKARRAQGTLDVLSTHFERTSPTARDRHALAHAVDRFATSVALRPGGPDRACA